MDKKQLDLSEPRFAQIFHREHRYCDCEIPMTLKKWQDALGTFVVIRVCCAAKALQEMLGIDLYQVFEFPPKWVWDCDELHEKDVDGVVEMVPRGVPPRWLLKRMLARGIEIRNLPDGTLERMSDGPGGRTVSTECDSEAEGRSSGVGTEINYGIQIGD